MCCRRERHASPLSFQVGPAIPKLVGGFVAEPILIGASAGPVAVFIAMALDGLSDHISAVFHYLKSVLSLINQSHDCACSERSRNRTQSTANVAAVLAVALIDPAQT